MALIVEHQRALEKLPCSVWARDHEVPLAATAGTHDGFLLAEWPHPWPRDAAEVEALAPAIDTLRAAGVRLQLVQSLSPGADRALRLVLYRRSDPSSFSGYVRSEATTSAPSIGIDALRLLQQPATEWTSDGVTDVLVCTHGKRDTCCGSAGTTLAMAAERSIGSPAVRVWRTSHLGGHRFAPTALVLPLGTMWGRLDEPALAGIVHQTLPADRAAAHFRGTCGIGPDPVQLLERVALATVGWGWLDTARTGSMGERGHVELTATGADGRIDTWSGVTVAGRTIPVPACRAPLSGSEKTETELLLTAYRHTAGAGAHEVDA
jgi:hypothetical protein